MFTETSTGSAAPRLLIVDDEAPILFAMSRYFTPLGYQVTCAAERTEAEALIASGPFAAAIVDLRLSDFSCTAGLEVIGRLRDRWPRTAIIVLTAYGSPAVEREALQRGVDAFLHKPQPLEQVARIVASLVAERG